MMPFILNKLITIAIQFATYNIISNTHTSIWFETWSKLHEILRHVDSDICQKLEICVTFNRFRRTKIKYH